MTELADIAPQFIEIAHRIVWCSAATVDHHKRPRSRVLHPYWEWDGTTLVGWIATGPTPTKRAHLQDSPYLSCSYWAPTQDAAVAECQAELMFDDDTRTRIWSLFKQTPPPLGYDPGGIGVPGWTTPTAASFAVLRLQLWRLKVLPGEVFLKSGSGGASVWREKPK